MFKFLIKLFGLDFSPINYDDCNEPEFLNEYWVYIGCSKCTTVYARTEQEAKAKVIRDDNVRGDVYAIYKRVSDLRNPAYSG